jgi:hypothetical protein
MNCQLFENVIDDLARGRMMDAGARESGLAHAGSCEPCAARLEAERALTSGLCALAVTDAERQAPERVEAALLSAFRQREARKVAGLKDASTPFVAPTRHATRSDAPPSIHAFADGGHASAPRFISGWHLRAAAAVVLFVFAAGLGILFWRGAEPSVVSQKSVKSVALAPTVEQPDNNSVAVVSSSPEEATRESRLTETAVAVLQNASDAPDEERDATAFASANNSRQQWRARPSQSTARFQEASAASSSSRRARAAQARSLRAGEENAEIVTDFFPLGGASALTAIEGGHVVRVEVPRAALASFGLPLNAESTAGRVKADVVIGDDGIARAIRFVR